MGEELYGGYIFMTNTFGMQLFSIDMEDFLERLGFEGFVIGMICGKYIMGDIKDIVIIYDAGGGYLLGQCGTCIWIG